MKRRFIAAGLAAATALSLSVAPAQAQLKFPGPGNGYNKQSSSQVTENEAGWYILGALAQGGADKGWPGFSKPSMGSSQSGMFKLPDDKAGAQQDLNNAFLSSYRNDANRGYKLGTTYDILVGTGIAAAILALFGVAQQQGLIKLPF